MDRIDVPPPVHNAGVAEGRAPGDDASQRQPWSAQFSATARTVADAARAVGLVPPAFRSPPASPDLDRSLRWQPDGRCVVAVRAAGRPLADIVGDLIEGVIAANRLTGDAADGARAKLLAFVKERLPDVSAA